MMYEVNNKNKYPMSKFCVNIGRVSYWFRLLLINLNQSLTLTIPFTFYFADNYIIMLSAIDLARIAKELGVLERADTARIKGEDA